MARERVSNGGHPSPYDPELDALAKDYCLLGATTDELAELFEVSSATIPLWMKRHKSFNDAVREGRRIADARVANALYRRAIGYSHPETHVATGRDAEGNPIVVQTEIVRHYPPDTAAAFIWLQNRMPDRWRRNAGEAQNTTPEEVALIAQQAISRAMATT